MPEREPFAECRRSRESRVAGAARPVQLSRAEFQWRCSGQAKRKPARYVPRSSARSPRRKCSQEDLFRAPREARPGSPRENRARYSRKVARRARLPRSLRSSWPQRCALRAPAAPSRRSGDAAVDRADRGARRHTREKNRGHHRERVTDSEQSLHLSYRRRRYPHDRRQLPRKQARGRARAHARGIAHKLS